MKPNLVENVVTWSSVVMVSKINVQYWLADPMVELIWDGKR